MGISLSSTSRGGRVGSLNFAGWGEEFDPEPSSLSSKITIIPFTVEVLKGKKVTFMSRLLLKVHNKTTGIFWMEH